MGGGGGNRTPGESLRGPGALAFLEPPENRGRGGEGPGGGGVDFGLAPMGGKGVCKPSDQVL